MGQQKVQAMMTSNSPPSSSSSSLRYVDHTYHDFSRFVEEGGKLVKHKKSGNNFPARLHRVLSSTDPCHSAVISWMVSLLCRVRPSLDFIAEIDDQQHPLAPLSIGPSPTVARGRSMTRIASYPMSYRSTSFARSSNRSHVSSTGGASSDCTSRDPVSFACISIRGDDYGLQK